MYIALYYRLYTPYKSKSKSYFLICLRFKLLWDKMTWKILQPKKSVNYYLFDNGNNKPFGSRAVGGKRFLESNASSIPGTFFRLG